MEYARIIRRFKTHLLIFSAAVACLFFFVLHTTLEGGQPIGQNVYTQWDRFKEKWNNIAPTTPQQGLPCDLKKSTLFATSLGQKYPKRWDFVKKVVCPTIDLKNISFSRPKVILDCANEPSIKMITTNNSSDIFQVQFGDKCLGRVIEKCCRDEKPVPNVVHYVYFGNSPLGFLQFLGYMSAVKFMKPCLVLLHGDSLPYGVYWDYFISTYPFVIHVNRSLVTTIYGQKLAFKEHGSDLMRIEALQEYGGVYLDWDQVLLKSLDPLRQYDYTQGMAETNKLTNGIIISKKNATFLNLWYQGYKNYSSAWIANSLIYPMKLARKYPELVHVETYNSLIRRETDDNAIHLFFKNMNWSSFYAMHLYAREYKKPIDIQVIRKLNITIGAVSRHILFDNKELCSN